MAFSKPLMALLAVLLLLTGIFLGTWIGEERYSATLVFQVLYNNIFSPIYEIDAIDNAIIWHYRLTRAIIAACCGGVLAICGAVLQSLLKNALADPYMLGVSAGASTGAVAVMLLGFGGGIIGVSMGAFIGALLAFGCALALSKLIRGYSGRLSAALLLAGIAISQFFNALTSFIVTKSANAEEARGIMFWLLGSFSGVRWEDVSFAVPVTLIASVIILATHRILDAFTFGDVSAASLGVNVKPVTLLLVLVTSLSTGFFISIVGAIGFVGLVVPHAARFLVGSQHRVILPASLVIGAIFMILADIGSRMLISQQVIPIGVVTALVGAPAFALILIRGKS